MINPERRQRIQQLWDAAMKRKASERAAFLKEACGEDEGLRREVESLLAHEQQALDFMEAPALHEASTTLALDRKPSLVGQQLGPYKVLSLLGAGGMGEVYLARDERLERSVAIKVLPSEYSSNADRLRRFEQEARAAGMLNHPNILTIHDIGTHQGSPYIVSELLEGETLRDRLKQGTVPLSKALVYALQITHGLAAAHDKQIVHRDLKPENLFITGDERVKILDFGLAKLRPSLGGIDAVTRTLSTAPGVVIGTIGYMSPEQVRAEEVDHRSDIFSFGAILYEMLEGRRAFVGKSAVEVMNAILKDEPAELQRDVPPPLEQVIKHSLEKDPASRFQSIKDLTFTLAMLSGVERPAGQTRLAKTVAAAEQRTVSSARKRVIWGLAIGLLLAASLFTIVAVRKERPDGTVARFPVLLPSNAEVAGSVAVSPDGRSLVFVLTLDGQNLLWLRRLDELGSRALAGTEGASQPFWSPDGRFIAFFTSGQLKKIPVSGGTAETLGNVAQAHGGTWSQTGTIVFQPDSGPLYRVSDSGGKPEQLTRVASPQESHLWPCFLPDGRHFLYLGRRTPDVEPGIYVASLDAPANALRLVATDSNAAYAAPGYLLFVREGVLRAQRFDPDRLRLTGPTESLAAQIDFNRSIGAAFSASPHSTVLAYWPRRGPNGQLVWFDRQGKQLESMGDPGEYLSPSLSPDDARVALERVDPESGKHNIWLLNRARKATLPLTFDPDGAHLPVWSPDGKQIVFASGRALSLDLYQTSATRAGEDTPLLLSKTKKRAFDWAADGRHIIYEDTDPQTKLDLWLLPTFGDRRPRVLVHTQFNETQGQLSPDGRWIAYASDDTGRFEVYVQSFPIPAEKLPASTKGGFQPKWRRDGKELFYLADNRTLMAVPVLTTTDRFEAGIPTPLFQTRISGPLAIAPSSNNHYTVAQDGTKFLVNTRTQASAPETITVVLNWNSALQR